MALANAYKARAAALLGAAIRATAPERRAGFYRDQIRADPVLRTIVRRPESPPRGGPPVTR